MNNVVPDRYLSSIVRPREEVAADDAICLAKMLLEVACRIDVVGPSCNREAFRSRVWRYVAEANSKGDGALADFLVAAISYFETMVGDD